MPSGADSYVNYGWEATFGAASETINKGFGHGVEITSVEKNNNLIRVYGLGARNAGALVPGKFEGRINMEFEPTGTAWWIKSLLGSISSSGTEAPYTHTYTELDSLPSFTIENGIDLTTDAVITYLGCVIEEAKFTFEEGQPSKVSLSILYADEAKTTASIGSADTEIDSPWSFAECALEVPNATAIANTQRAELTIKNNSMMIYGLGSRTASTHVEGEREYTLVTTNYFDDAVTYLEALYGSATAAGGTPSAVATCELNMTNAGAGALERRISVLLANGLVQSHDLPQKVNEALMETAELYMRSCTSIIMVNGTAAV